MEARRALGLALIAACATLRSAWALTDEDIYRSLRIPPVTPSGRTAAMGGAGVAVVDDSAASQINPARLSAIARPEFYLLGMDSTSARTSTDPSLFQFDSSVNPFAGSRLDSTVSGDPGPAAAFFSFAYPLPIRSRPLVLAIARELPLDLSIESDSSDTTVPLSAPVTPNSGDEVIRPSSGSLAARMEVYSLSGGWRITPAFAVGAGVRLARLRLSSATLGLLADPLQFTAPGMFDPRFSSSDPQPLVETTSEGDDSDVTYSFGAWWRPDEAFSVATVYRRGARFEVPADSRDHFTGERDSFTNTISQPDTAALGIAWNPFYARSSTGLQHLTFVMDLEWVGHSVRTDGLRAQENVLTRREFLGKARYDAEDATEVRLGGEYRLAFVTWTLALRAGGYSSHDGGLRLEEAEGDVGALQGWNRGLQKSDFFRDRGVEWHATVGAGADFDSFSLDVAADLSEPSNRYLVSITCRLPESR